MTGKLKTPGGSQIITHEKVTGDPNLGPVARNLETIHDHLSRFLGECGDDLHEIVSEYAHIDLLVFPPNEERDFSVISTSGLSDKPMNIPDNVADRASMAYCELLMALPADWNGGDLSDMEESAWYPLGFMKAVARIPHIFDTWIWCGHSIPNGDPPEPLHPSTNKIGAFLELPYLLDPGIARVQTETGETIQFLGLYFLTADEMEFKLEQGSEALMDLLLETLGGEALIFDATRESVLLQKPLVGHS
jgi:hypothetical protein